MSKAEDLLDDIDLARDGELRDYADTVEELLRALLRDRLEGHFGRAVEDESAFGAFWSGVEHDRPLWQLIHTLVNDLQREVGRTEQRFHDAKRAAEAALDQCAALR